MCDAPRRDYEMALKIRAAADAPKGEQKIAELSRRYQIHPNHLIELKRLLLEHIGYVIQQEKSLSL